MIQREPGFGQNRAAAAAAEPLHAEREPSRRMIGLMTAVGVMRRISAASLKLTASAARRNATRCGALIQRAEIDGQQRQRRGLLLRGAAVQPG